MSSNNRESQTVQVMRAVAVFPSSSTSVEMILHGLQIIHTDFQTYRHIGAQNRAHKIITLFLQRAEPSMNDWAKPLSINTLTSVIQTIAKFSIPKYLQPQHTQQHAILQYCYNLLGQHLIEILPKVSKATSDGKLQRIGFLLEQLAHPPHTIPTFSNLASYQVQYCETVAQRFATFQQQIASVPSTSHRDHLTACFSQLQHRWLTIIPQIISAYPNTFPAKIPASLTLLYTLLPKKATITSDLLNAVKIAVNQALHQSTDFAGYLTRILRWSTWWNSLNNTSASHLRTFWQTQVTPALCAALVTATTEVLQADHSHIDNVLDTSEKFLRYLNQHHLGPSPTDPHYPQFQQLHNAVQIQRWMPFARASAEWLQSHPKTAPSSQAWQHAYTQLATCSTTWPYYIVPPDFLTTLSIPEPIQPWIAWGSSQIREFIQNALQALCDYDSQPQCPLISASNIFTLNAVNNPYQALWEPMLQAHPIICSHPDLRHVTQPIPRSSTPAPQDWDAWLRDMASHDLNLTEHIREQLSQWQTDTRTRLHHRTMSPPGGWRSPITHPIFRQWGWHSIAVIPAPYQWGTIQLETDHGPFTFAIGPKAPTPSIEWSDAIWYAYTWFLAWIEGFNHRDTLTTGSSVSTTSLPPSIRRDIILQSQRFALHRTLGRSPSIPVSSRRHKASRHQQPHPVSSHIHRHPTNPQYRAPDSVQRAAERALIQIPLGYTFIRAHWSPRHFTPNPQRPQWIRIFWGHNTAMHQWQTLTTAMTIPSAAPSPPL